MPLLSHLSVRNPAVQTVLVAGLLGAATADASLVTYSFTRTGKAIVLSNTFAIPQFDPDAGELETVVLTVTGHSIGGANRVENEDAVSGQAQLTLGTRFQVDGPANLGIAFFPHESADSGPNGVAADDPAETPDPDWTGTDCFAITGGTCSDTQTATRTGDTADLTPYLGTETVAFSWSAVVNAQNVVTFATLYRVDTPDYLLSASITYHYEGVEWVPEPGSACLLVVICLTLTPGRRTYRARTISKTIDSKIISG